MWLGQVLRALFWMVAALAAIETVSHTTAAAPPTAAAVAKASSLLQGEWVNGAPTTLTAQRGKVVVLTFWTFECSNCQRTLPRWNDWAKRYGPGSDVAVLSVHAPESSSQSSPEAVRRFVLENDLRFPVVRDNEFRTWQAFGVRAWPTTLLLDRRGRVAGRWEGDLESTGAYKEVERRIEALRRS